MSMQSTGMNSNDPSSTATPFEPSSKIYTYDRDIPTQHRPHLRHRHGGPVLEDQSSTGGVAEPCPCQNAREVAAHLPFPSQSAEAQFWIDRHLSMPRLDFEAEHPLEEERRRLQEVSRRQEEFDNRETDGSTRANAFATTREEADCLDPEEREIQEQEERVEICRNFLELRFPKFADGNRPSLA